MKGQSHGLAEIESIKSLFCVRPTRAALLIGGQIMDKDRIEGSVKEIKGKIKEVAGKVLGDAKLETEGKADQVAGKVQNAAGGIKDTVKGA